MHELHINIVISIRFQEVYFTFCEDFDFFVTERLEMTSQPQQTFLTWPIIGVFLVVLSRQDSWKIVQTNSLEGEAMLLDSISFLYLFTYQVPITSLMLGEGLAGTACRQLLKCQGSRGIN